LRLERIQGLHPLWRVVSNSFSVSLKKFPAVECSPATSEVKGKSLTVSKSLFKALVGSLALSNDLVVSLASSSFFDQSHFFLE